MLSLLQRFLLNGHLQYLRDGITQFNRGEFDNAVSSFNAGLKIHDTFVPLWNSKGVALMYKEQYKDALACFIKTLELDPGNLTALVAQGVICSKLKNVSLSIALYNSVEDQSHFSHPYQILDQDFYIIHAKLASIKLCLGYQSLNEKFAELINSLVNDIRDWSGGSLLDIYLKFSDSIINREKVSLEYAAHEVGGKVLISSYTIEDCLRSARIKARIIKANIFSLQGKWEEALQLFDVIPEQLPLSMRTDSVESTTQWPVEYLFRFGSFNEPEEKKVYLAIFKMHLGRLVEAKDHFNAALKDNPSAIEAQLGLGMLFLLQNDWAAAKVHFQEILTENKDLIIALIYRGYALLNNNELNEAKDCFERACQENNPSPLAILGKSLVARANRDDERSEFDYKQALAILNKRSEYVAERLECYLLYGKSCLVLGAFDKARVALEQALQLKPGYIHAEKALGELSKAEAKQHLQQAPSDTDRSIELLEQALEHSVENVNKLEVLNRELENKIIQLSHEVEMLEKSLRVALDNSDKAEKTYQADLVNQKKLIEQLMGEIERLNNLLIKNRDSGKNPKDINQKNKELKLINNQKDDKILELKRKIQQLEEQIKKLSINEKNISSNPASHWNQKSNDQFTLPLTDKLQTSERSFNH